MVPRNSVLKKKGLFTLRTKLAFGKSRKSTKKSKVKKTKSLKATSLQNLSVPVGVDLSRKRPSYDAAMSAIRVHSSDDETELNIPFSVDLRDKYRHSSAENISKPRSKSSYNNVNNNNCIKPGNMALNIEKERLRKLASRDPSKDLISKMKRLTVTATADL